MVTTHPLEKAIALRGLNRLARDVGLTHQALRRWQRQGRLPRTEWTGETAYARQIAKVVDGKVSESELLSAWPKWPADAGATKSDGDGVATSGVHGASVEGEGDRRHSQIAGGRI